MKFSYSVSRRENFSIWLPAKSRSGLPPGTLVVRLAVGMANLPSQVVHELLSVSGFGDGALDGAVYFRSREVLEAGF